jgi:intron-binding protein aquarius
MTCTHAALKRREFVELAFKYDNLLMEEAAQILEIETFIPMLLQVSCDTGIFSLGICK